jgi:2-oxoacid:acceptor oxidoreductase delta subunit (pyruvate/2-ketoisovalerate family)
MSLHRATELSPGGAVIVETAHPARTGDWRSGVKPRANLDTCVNCLLCWVYCPDSAVLTDGDVFTGFDYDVCKGCQVCAEMCPVGAIEMVDEAVVVPDRGVIRGGGDA